MSQLFQSCRDLIQEKNASVRTVSQIIGKLTSSVKAVLPAPLQWARGTKLCFPWAKIVGRPSRVDRSNVHTEWSLNNHTSPRFDHNNKTSGWGGVCQGKYTRGIWTREGSSSLHINALELKAACFAVRAFTVNQRHLHVHLRMDNRTAVAYLLKMGGDAIPFIARDSPGTVGLCLKQADNSDCRISAWGFEPRSRLAVNKFPGFEQLETKPYSFPVTKSSVDSPDNRSVCRSHEYSASDLYHLVSRPIGAKDGCLSDHLVTVFLLSQWYVAVWQRSKRFTQWLFS